jgi:hypothetical protein
MAKLLLRFFYRKSSLKRRFSLPDREDSMSDPPFASIIFTIASRALLISPRRAHVC